jgi:hypothetical protein
MTTVSSAAVQAANATPAVGLALAGQQRDAGDLALP